MEPTGADYLYGAEVLSVDVDNSGNVYSTGWFRGSTEFYPVSAVTIPTASDKSIFVLKQDPLGNVIWVKTFLSDNMGDNKGASIKVDINGDIVVNGQFWGTVDFDPTATTNNITSQGSSDFFILKMDGNGNMIWVKTVGGTSRNEGVALVIDDDANIYSTGIYWGLTDFDPGPGTYNMMSQSTFYRDVFALKLSSAGNFIWAKSVGSGGNGSDYAANIDLDSNNNVVFGGWFGGSGDFNPGSGTTTLSSGNSYQVFFVKLDSAGNYIWAKSTEAPSPGFNGFAQCLNFKVAPSGDIYFTGIYSNRVDFNPSGSSNTLTTPNSSSRWGYIAKWSSAGNYEYVKAITGDYNSFNGYGMDIDTSENIYLTGYFSNTVDFSPGAGQYNISSNGIEDIFLLKLNSLAVLEYVRKFGKISSLENNEGNCVVLDNTENIYLGGFYKDTLDIDPSYLSYNLINTPTSLNNTSSGLVSKFSPCLPTTGSMTVNHCGPYTAPSGAILTNSGIHQDIILNTQGCDSIITINYTDRNSYFFMTVDRCATYTVPSGNQTVSTPGTYTLYDTLPSTFGCDSVLEILLNINDRYYTYNGPVCDSIFNYSQLQWISTDGIYHDTTFNLSGCRNFHTDTFQFYPTTYGVNNMNGCESVTSLSGNQTWTTSGIYTDTIPNSSPGQCDSIISTTVTIYPLSYDTIYPVSCVTYTSPIGAVYNSSGTYQNILPNASSNGCDSVLTIHLTILQPIVGGIDSIWSCNSVQSQTGHQIWSSSGIYTDTLYNIASNGCDSIFNVIVEIPVQNLPTIQASACDTMISFSGNQLWYSSGYYIDTLPNIQNQYGCDSIIRVNYNTLRSGGFMKEEYCSSGSFTAPSGKVFTTSGTYKDTISNHLGCDSIINIDLYMNIGESYINQVGNNLHMMFPNWPPYFTIFNAETRGDDVICAFNHWNPWWFTGNGTIVATIAGSGQFGFETKVHLTSNQICYNAIPCQPYYMVGIQENTLNDGIDIHPNPTKDITTVTFTEKPTDISYTLLDITGREIIQNKLSNSINFSINLGELMNGMYLLYINADDKAAILKIVKED